MFFDLPAIDIDRDSISGDYLPIPGRPLAIPIDAMTTFFRSTDHP
jgi:hypothetical protein